MATFMTLVNLVLSRLNEVQLTSSTFASAQGPQAVMQGAVNAAVMDICRREQQWPFKYSKQTFLTTAGVQEYTPPTTVSDIKWNTFGVSRDDNAKPAIAAFTLQEMDYNTWATRKRAQDQQTNSTNWSQPQTVIKGDDGNIILSPPPKTVSGGNGGYLITYDAWADPSLMVNYNDTCIIPDKFSYIIGDGAIWYGYDFRGDEVARKEAENKFNRGVQEMQRQLIKPTNGFQSTMLVNGRTFNSIPSRFGL